MEHAHTLATEVVREGVGLHSGQRGRVRLGPGSEGLVFMLGGQPVPATVGHVVDTQLATTLGLGGRRVQTVEHLLSALRWAGVDHATIHVEGPEIPALDGSARPWLQAISQAGLRSLGVPRRWLVVRQPIQVSDGERVARLLPATTPQAWVRVRFEHAAVGEQRFGLTLDPASYADQVAWARTFGFLEHAQALRRMGLVLGADLDNAVVFGPDGVINPGGLRASDEPVRHKLLDALGDLALAGLPVRARLEAELPGHALTVGLVRALLGRPDAWSIHSSS